MKEIQLNSVHTEETEVTAELLASFVGSGSVDVYATPMMIALMEKASAALLQTYLDEGETSVGILMNTTHSAATPKGMKVSATAEIINVEGKKVTFKVIAKDEKDIIGEATHERFIVMSEKFVKRCYSKLD